MFCGGGRMLVSARRTAWHSTIYIYIYVYIYIYIYMCIRVYTYIYIYTYYNDDSNNDNYDDDYYYYVFSPLLRFSHLRAESAHLGYVLPDCAMPWISKTAAQHSICSRAPAAANLAWAPDREGKKDPPFPPPPFLSTQARGLVAGWFAGCK